MIINKAKGKTMITYQDVLNEVENRAKESVGNSLEVVNAFSNGVMSEMIANALNNMTAKERAKFFPTLELGA